MNIGIFYATYSGGTQAACEFLTQNLKKSGHKASIKPISEIDFEDSLNYDLRVFASPSWDFDGKEGQPHQDFIDFMKKYNGKKFEEKRCAVLGLGDSSYAYFCGAVVIIEDFIKKANGKLVIESLKIDGYFYKTDENNTKISDWAKKLTS